MSSEFEDIVFTKTSFYELSKSEFAEYFREFIQENNIIIDSESEDKYQLFYSQSFTSPEPYQYTIKFKGRYKNEDDDTREQIDFMISQMPEL